jgi:hypothetical protein
LHGSVLQTPIFFRHTLLPASEFVGSLFTSTNTAAYSDARPAHRHAHSSHCDASSVHAGSSLPYARNDCNGDAIVDLHAYPTLSTIF